MATVTIAVRSAYMTAERVVFRQLGRYVPGVLEATLDTNRGLAALGTHLPVGTSIAIAQPTTAQLAEAVEVIRLTD